MTEAQVLQGSAAPVSRAENGFVVLLMGFMLASARLSRMTYFTGVFFVFITTTRLGIPLFFSFDKLFLILSFVFWLLSPAPIVGIFRGTAFLRLPAIGRNHLPAVSLFVCFAAIKLFDAVQRISLGRLNVMGLFGYAIQEAPYALLPLMVCVHARSTRDLVSTLNTALYAMALSSIVALGIYFDLSSVFLDLRDALVTPNSLFPNMGRLPFRYFQAGLSASAYSFSYHMSLAIPATFFVILGIRTLQSRLAHILLLMVFLMTLGVVGTRTPFIGCTVGILYGYAKLAKVAWKQLAGVLLVGILVMAAFAFGGLAIQERFQGETLALDFLDKFWAQLAAFISLPSNPWGVGYGTVEGNEYVNALNADIRVVHLPHFHFITAILFWGFPGLIFSAVFCMALWTLFRSTALPESIRSLDPGRRMVAAAGVAGLLSSLINGMAHNPGPFFSDYTSWLSLGLIVASVAGRENGGESA